MTANLVAQPTGTCVYVHQVRAQVLPYLGPPLARVRRGCVCVIRDRIVAVLTNGHDDMQWRRTAVAGTHALTDTKVLPPVV